jgi:intracellular multiplication protein IcmO
MHANRLNAFVAGDADAIGEVLSGPLGEPALDDANVFRQRAAALVDALAPVLVWMRDHKGVLLNIDTVRLSFELRSTWKVANEAGVRGQEPDHRRDGGHSRPRDAGGSDLSAQDLS